MELLQLKYFQVVARLGNITQAAKELHIAQPSLSKTIVRLEENLGVPLFERAGRRIRLNQYGESFLRRVDRIFHELEDGQRELADLAGLECRNITVGASSSRLLTNLFEKYLICNPNVKFCLRRITKQQEMQKQLLNREIDLSISFLPITHPELHCEPLFNEEIYLALPPTHRLAHRKSIHLNEVANEPFISLTTDFDLWKITSEFCRQEGFTPNIAFEIENIEVIVSLVNAGLGITFLPEYWQQGAHAISPVKLHIEPQPCRRTVWLSWIKGGYLTEATSSFKNFTIEYFSSDVKQCQSP